MAAIPVTIVGMMSYSGLEVGGGPIVGGPPAQPPTQPPPTVSPPIYYPPEVWPPPGGPVYPAHPIAPGGPPPVAGWTPPGYHPAHPIAPGGPPPTVSPPIYYPPFPAHPIVLPPEQLPTEPPSGGNGGGGSWSYSPAIGWYWTSPGGRWVYVAGDKPRPPEIPGQPPPTDPNAPVVNPLPTS